MTQILPSLYVLERLQCLSMHKGRLEAFSDAVIAIIMTVMVLELHAPKGVELTDLVPIVPTLLCYILSFAFLAIYWNNHHHLLQSVKHVNGASLWANMHLLLWLSFIPFVTAWMGAHPHSQVPIACYGSVLFLCGVSYFILSKVLIAANGGSESTLALALGKDTKGIASVLIYLVGIGTSWVSTVVPYLCFVLVAVMWFVPDKRIERTL